MDAKQRYLKIRQASMVGALVNILLAIIKITFGLIGHSYALVADGIHSLSDLLTDLLVVVGSYFGSQEADHDHPYGHRRIETAATLLLALLLTLVGAGIMYDAGEYFFFEKELEIMPMVLWIIALSILANELLYHYTQAIARETQSELLSANAWHHRSDAFSSVVVLIGVSGSILGVANLDALAAIFVGAMIIRMGWRLSWSSIQELIDTAVDQDTHNEIAQIIRAVPGVKSMHQLRTRMMGGKILVDVHIMVNPKISVSEGHYIAQQVHHVLASSNMAIVDVTAHIDSEEDEAADLNLPLPPREDIVNVLNQNWQDLPYFANIQTINLHYLAGKISIEVVLTGPNTDSIALTQQYYQNIEQTLPVIELTLLWR